MYNLSKINPKRIASLIVNGNLQLDEVPSDRRAVVKGHIESIEAKNKPTPTTAKEIKAVLDDLGVPYEKGTKKAELLALLLSKQQL